MKLYNLELDKIENIKTINTDDGVRYVNKLTTSELVVQGYYPIEYTTIPNRRYYTYTVVKSIINDVYTVTYSPIERPLATVIGLMEKDLRETYYKTYLELPRIDTGLGYDVWGSLESVEELRMWKDYGFDEIIDADDNTQSVDGNSYSTIGNAIKTYRRLVYDRRKNKVSQVKNLTSIDACILFEHSPYDCPEYDDEGVLTGATTTCYRNLVKDWEI